MPYRWKVLDESNNFALNLISIRCLQKKSLAPKATGVLSLRISGLPLGSLRTKCHLNVALVERH
jgi:hypothetical protein